MSITRPPDCDDSFELAGTHPVDAPREAWSSSSTDLVKLPLHVGTDRFVRSQHAVNDRVTGHQREAGAYTWTLTAVVVPALTTPWMWPGPRCSGRA